MTVNTTDITSGPYSGDDLTSSFSYTFRVENKNQVSVYETDDNGTETLLTVDTHYTVNNIGTDGGGTIDRVAGALPTGYTWYIRSNYQYTQDIGFSSQGAYFPDIHEEGMDKLTFLIQQILDKTLRSVRLSDNDISGTDTILPDIVAGRAIGWNATGDGLTNLIVNEGDTVGAAQYEDYYTITAADVAGNNDILVPLSVRPSGINDNNLQIRINGVAQDRTAYTYNSAATTISFSGEYPDEDDVIVFVTGELIGTLDIPSSAVVPYIPAGTGAVATDVQSKLREFVSVADKGVDNTGVEDASAAFTNAQIDSATVIVPSGTYKLDSSPTGNSLILCLGTVTFTGVGTFTGVVLHIKDLSYGANDSGGAGFKLLRVPN